MQNSEIFMAPPDELDADGKAVFGEASANDSGGLPRLIEHSGVCRDVQQPSFVRGGSIRREADDVSRGCDDQIEWERPFGHSGFCAFQFVARLQELLGIDLRATGDQSVKRRMDQRDAARYAPTRVVERRLTLSSGTSRSEAAMS